MTPRLRPAWLLMTACLVTPACFAAGWDTPASSPDTAPSCQPLAQLFTETLWQPYMASQCANCHVQGGQAGSGTFVLDPNDATASFWATRSVARMTAANGNSLLLAAIAGSLNHPPPAPLDANTPVYLNMVQFSRRALQNELDCPSQP